MKVVGRGRKKEAKLGFSALFAKSLKLLITGNMISESVLTLLYWDLNGMMENLTLKTLFVNSPSWLSWAFHLVIWGRKD